MTRRLLARVRLVLLLALLSFSWPFVASAQVALEGDAPREYRVKAGDTLWGIADMYLQEPWLWQALWAANPQVENPDLIYPGDVLYLTYDASNTPRLSLRRGGEVKLKPGVRVTPLDLAIPLIGLDEIGAFLRRNRVLDRAEASFAPYILGSNKQNLLSAPGDVVVSRGDLVDQSGDANQMYGIYRLGQRFSDPLTGEVLGFEARVIGSAQRLESVTPNSDLTEFEVKAVNEEIRQGDRLLPMRERVLDAVYQPRAPEQTIQDGYMIAVEGGVSQIGSLNTVILNRGSREGLEVGHVLAIFQSGDTVYDNIANESVKLPDVRAGLLMVFEVFEKSSLAVVLKASRPLSVMDKVKNP